MVSCSSRKLATASSFSCCRFRISVQRGIAVRQDLLDLVIHLGGNLLGVGTGVAHALANEHLVAAGVEGHMAQALDIP